LTTTHRRSFQLEPYRYPYPHCRRLCALFSRLEGPFSHCLHRPFVEYSVSARFVDSTSPDPAAGIDQHFQHDRAFQASAARASRIPESRIGLTGCRLADAVTRSLRTRTRLDGSVCRGLPSFGSGQALAVRAVALMRSDLCGFFRLSLPGYLLGRGMSGCLPRFPDLGRGNLAFLRRGTPIRDHFRYPFIGLRLTGLFPRSRGRAVCGVDRGIARRNPRFDRGGFRLILDRCNRFGVRRILGSGLRYPCPCRSQDNL